MAGDFDEQAVFITGPVVVFKWRNEPGWPVEYVSPNAEEVFGHAAEAFLSGRVVYADLIHPDDGERVSREVEAASAGQASSFVHEPYRVLHKSGEARWLYDATRIQRSEDGRPVSFLGYVIDISARVAAETEKRELERRLNHAQKLESLGVLAGGVAHDFNNVLTGILAHAGLAKRAVGTEAPQATESLQQIERLALGASQWTRQLLAYAGKGSFVAVPLDLSELAREMVGMIEVIVPRTATLRLELARGLPSVVADRGEIQQVIMNLLTNAVDALGDRPGEVTIRTELQHLDEQTCALRFAEEALAAGDFVHLSVSDTGCGMSPDVKAKLFDPFFTTKQSGRGLGMSAVLGIVRAHRGAVRVESEPGRGTSFRLWFPSTWQAKAAPPSPVPPVKWRGAGTVLIVDDDEAIRLALRTLLTEMGFATAIARDGAEALAVFDSQQDEVVLVLLDLTMPVMNGAETFAALTARRPDVPVIVMSGYTEQQAVDGLVEGERTAFLGKPFAVEELEAAVKVLLGSR
ncbi:MAG: response regulator [Myxococcales bacterium]|nr:response regulator [Myxococcales bacterium]